MKYMIASDVHGSAYYCREMIAAFEREEADRLLLLGDILYHGPRNDLPDGYAPKQVIAMLTPLAKDVLCVQGNCDTEVDQMVLPFPVLNGYAVLFADGKALYCTHGHRPVPPLAEGDYLLCGHTHVPKCEKREGYVYINCGSVSIPKEGSPHSYMIYEDGIFYWKTMEGEVYMQYDGKK